MSIFVFSAERFVLWNYRKCTWNIWFLSLTVSVFCCTVTSPLGAKRQEIQLWDASSTVLPAAGVQYRGVVVRLHNLISSPPILGLSTGNSTTKLTPWGQKTMPLLSYLLCGFYVCSKADSAVLKISCEVISLTMHLLLGFIINSEHVSLLYY